MAAVAGLVSMVAVLAAACESQSDQCKLSRESRGGSLIQQTARTFRGDDKEIWETKLQAKDWVDDFLRDDIARLQQLDLQQVHIDSAPAAKASRNHVDSTDSHPRAPGAEASLLVTAVKGNNVIEIDMDPFGKAPWQQISVGDGTTLKLRAPQPSTETNVGHMVSTILITSLVAFVFRQELKTWPPVDPNADPTELKEWSTGGMACFSDMPSCLCACCCLPVVWADNADMVGYLKFWIAFAAVLFLRAACVWPAVFGLAYIITIIIFTLFRRHLRRIFDMPGQDCGGLVCDYCFICCYMCCAVAQEARHIQDASRAGHASIQRPMVGEPVQATSRAGGRGPVTAAPRPGEWAARS
eukprot:TRINITY_DN107572_c0_g1_i1.p1 TRINITY_DN107572_c0_g1~~TRINITY_DN107572_c0_g1_i1.p1  ORF type:complete len:355 (+),score=50.83 TRINITY_DN107572_c0_g1_i1:96-1160(+)